MNKKYFGSIALASIAMLSASCSDFLEQDNRSNVSTESFYTTSTGFESLTNSMYSSLRAMFNMQPNLFVGGTDLYGDGKSESVEYTYYTLTPASGGLKTFYDNCYKGIQLCNAVIAYSEKTQQTALVPQYVAEARVIRAWYYFQLVQQFGGVPLANEQYTSAVMSFERSSLKDCYAFIISELEAVANGSDLKGAAPVRANKRAAQFLLAKAYLTRGWLNGQGDEAIEENIAEASDFANAEKYASAAIGSQVPAESIETAFDVNNEGSAEFFWTVQYSGDAVNNPKNDGSYQMAQFGAYLGGAEMPNNKAIDGNYSPLFNLHKQFDKGDGRYEQTFMLEYHGESVPKSNYFGFYNDKDSKIWCYYAPWWATDEDIDAWKAAHAGQLADGFIVSKTAIEGGIAPSNGAAETYRNRRHMDHGVPCIRKFDDYSANSISNRNSTCSMHDVSIARLGEAYLVAAEAAVMQNKKGEAANYINTLRKRPGTVKAGFEEAMTVKEGDMTIEFILKERACEMAGEYVRWTDLKRTHKLIEYVKLYQEDPIDHSKLTGVDGKPRILRPYPQDAIDLNQANVQQNPGW